VLPHIQDVGGALQAPNRALLGYSLKPNLHQTPIASRCPAHAVPILSTAASLPCSPTAMRWPGSGERSLGKRPRLASARCWRRIHQCAPKTPPPRRGPTFPGTGSAVRGKKVRALHMSALSPQSTWGPTSTSTSVISRSHPLMRERIKALRATSMPLKSSLEPTAPAGPTSHTGQPGRPSSVLIPP
jgi:hypothetical protein